MVLNTILDRFAFRPLGAGEEEPLEARLVFATWREPALVLRPDLWDRLAPWVVRLPPPSPDRIRDALLDWVVGFAHAHGAPPLRPRAALCEQLVRDAVADGSFRPVRARLLRAYLVAVHAGATAIGPEHLEATAPPLPADPRRAAQRLLVRQGLDAAAGNVSDAARTAGVSRSTFHRWMVEAGISRPRG